MAEDIASTHERKAALRRFGGEWRPGRDGLGVGVEVPDDQERPSNLIDVEDLDVVQRYGVR